MDKEPWCIVCAAVNAGEGLTEEKLPELDLLVCEDHVDVIGKQLSPVE